MLIEDVMRCRRFSHPELFRQHIEPFLLEHEAKNNLILGILNDIITGKYINSEPYMACVENNDGIVLVALRTPPHNLLLSDTSLVESIAMILSDVHEIYSTLPGISAIDNISQIATEQWSAKTGQSYHLKMDQGIYQLTSVNELDYATGSIRPITEDDSEVVVTWFQAFLSGVYGEVSEDDAKSTLGNILRSPLDRSRLFVWEVDGVPMTMAGYTGATPNGLRITYVYTPVEYRRNGYATACTAGVSQIALDMG
jgi:uncharacterized protein